MLDLLLLDGFAVDVLRLVAWANVGVAVALLVGVVVWLACCRIESGRQEHGVQGRD